VVLVREAPNRAGSCEGPVETKNDDMATLGFGTFVALGVDLCWSIALQEVQWMSGAWTCQDWFGTRKGSLTDVTQAEKTAH
jgi:uncharacterized membrane protein YcjF (UPF0283 family)